MYPTRHLDYYLLKPDIIQNKPQAYNPTILFDFRGKEIGKLKRKGMLQLIAEFEPSHATTFGTNLTIKFRKTCGRSHTNVLKKLDYRHCNGK